MPMVSQTTKRRNPTDRLGSNLAPPISAAARAGLSIAASAKAAPLRDLYVSFESISGEAPPV
jgi:hypothetical protein